MNQSTAMMNKIFLIYLYDLDDGFFYHPIIIAIYDIHVGIGVGGLARFGRPS